MWIDIFPKKTYRWPTGTWKAARCWASPEKCKLKPQRDITSHLSERLSSKRTEITNVDEDVEKRDPLYTVGGNVNWYSHYENNMEVSQKIKNRTRIWPSNSTPVYVSGKKWTLIQKHKCTPMFTAASFTIAEIRKQPKCPPTYEWIKLWYIYIYTYTYSRILLSHKKRIKICLLQQHGWT